MWNDFKDLISGTLSVVGMFLWACIILVIIAALGYGAFCVFETTRTPEQKEAKRLADIAERTPHVYSQIDNCTVYIWKNGDYNSYFTKCDNTNKVVTEFSHRESCGKACSKQVREKVETN